MAMADEVVRAGQGKATGAAEAMSGKRVLLDYKRAPVWFERQLNGAKAVVEDYADPCIVPRACKTPEEQEAIIDAHIRDGVAVTRFLAWLDEDRHIIKTRIPEGYVCITSIKTAICNVLIDESPLSCIGTGYSKIVIPSDPTNRIGEFLQPWISCLISTSHAHF